MSKRPVASTLLFILFVMTATAAASAAASFLEWHHDPEGGGHYALASATTLSEPFTVQSVFQLVDTRSEPTLWLAGLAAAQEGPPDSLALQWKPETTGWFPVWKLQLTSRLDLFPPDLVDRREGELALIELAQILPRAGRQYRASLSHDPHGNTLSILLEDLAEGVVLYSAHLPIRPGAAVTLYPGAGWQVPQNQRAAADAVEFAQVIVSAASQRYGLPLALKRAFKSRLLERSPEDGSLKAKFGIEYLEGESVGLRIEWPTQPVAGRVLVTSLSQAGAPAEPGLAPATSPPAPSPPPDAAAEERRLLASLEWQAESHDLVFDPASFPLGESILVLEYADGEHRAEIERHSVRVIRARVGARFVVDGQDFDRNMLVGALTLWPEVGVVEDAELVVHAAHVPQDAALQPGPRSGRPVHEVRRYFDRLDGSVTIPLEIPVPDEEGTLRLTAAFSAPGVLLAGGSQSIRVKGVDAVPDDPSLFPFVVNPWQESPDNVTNVAHWLPKPAGKSGFIAVKDGHFVTGDGNPIRFLGVNCAFSGCFPDHASAEKLARQLARFGINLVRFHHMDAREAPGGIWRPGVFPRELDPDQLDRLDYFIYQLKENGIYSNLNLHVSRTMSPQEGYPEPEKRPSYDKGLSLYDPGIMEHQKAYARALLTHRNPYTGNRYVDEPAIAMIEITNENGLILFTQRGQIDELPARYREHLDALWQRWLRDRYGTTEALAEAWGGGSLRSAREVAANGRLDQGLAHWVLETDEASRGAAMRVVPDGGPVISGPVSGAAGAPRNADGRTAQGQDAEGQTLPALQVTVDQKGSVAWRPQFYHIQLDLKPGKVYHVSFWIKADRQDTVTSNVMMHHDPWQQFGSFSIPVTTQWQRHEFSVRVPDAAQVRQGRVSFNNLEAGTSYWIAGLSVLELEGDGIGLPDGESFETGISRPVWQGLGGRSAQVRRDYIEFLWDVEQAYFDEMYRYIKEELGAHAPVSGTQVPWSPTGIQARLDYVDAHAYWNHPVFPGTPWDASDWYVVNNSMTSSANGGTIASLAQTRVAGKPYVVSEYNHPAPITFSSEAFLLTGAYAAFQDWDGLFAFAWSHNADFWPQRITSYFDIKSHPTKLVTLPAVAALFLRGDVRAGSDPVYAAVDNDAQRRRLLEGSAFSVGSAVGGVPPVVALQQPLAIIVDGVPPPGAGAGAGTDRPGPSEAGRIQGSVTVPPAGRPITSSTGELRWERPESGRGVVLIDAKRSKAVIGYGGSAQEGSAGRRFDLSGVTIEPGPTKQDGWAAITLTAMDGADFQSPGRILLTATGYVENTGMGWERLDGDRITVRNRWGEAPSLVEGIPARIELPVAPERVAVYALDGAGNRREQVPVGGLTGDNQAPSARAVIEIGPQYRTLWYEIEITP